MTKNDLVKLDLKDKKILYELDKNSRQSCSQIGKKVGLSTEVVNYRIKRLEKENIITGYILALNLSKIGIYQFKLCISLQHINSKILKEIIEKIKQNKHAKWVVSCKGNWDLIISVETESFNEINLVKDELLSYFKGHIREKRIAVLAQGYRYDRTYFLKDSKKAKPESILYKELDNFKLDKLDREIISELSKNSRTPIIDLAHKLKQTPRVIDYRIKNLQKKEIITGFKTTINYNKLGIKFYKTFIYLDSSNPLEITKLKNYIKSHGKTIHNAIVIGNWDFEPEFEVYSEEEFDKIIKEIKDKFSDIIRRIDIITISREHKFVYI